jgi:murein L,D-transpeptidase YcbB/YkuD
VATRLTPVPPAGVRPGERYGAAARLRRLLAALGDLDSRAGAPRPGDTLFTTELSEGIRRWQARQGGTGAGGITRVDGRLTDATRRLLGAQLAPRIRQMELALERWRWLPRGPYDTPIVVTLPARRLSYAGRTAEGEPFPLEMRVQPGRACPAEQPVQAGSLRLLLLRPADPALGSVQFPLDGGGGAGFLHGTSPDARRSAPGPGCLWLADAELLAEHLLRERGDWSGRRLREVLAGARPVYVSLHRVVPFLLVYTTAVAREKGQVYFFRDEFRHDARLAQALARGYPYDGER